MIGSVIHISKSTCPDFSDMRISLGKTFHAVREAICSMEPPLDCEDIKAFIRFTHLDLKPRLAICQKVVDVLEVIREHCSLFNIALLEAVVDNFNIDSAKPAIQKYNAEIRKFFESAIENFCLEEKVTLCSLKCETITITVDKNVDETSYKDIDDLMTSAFRKLTSAIHVYIIRKGNSFTITCSFPLTLSALLISKALKNLKILKEKGVIKLTIGYCAVYDYKEVNK